MPVMSPSVLTGLGLLRLATGMRTRHAVLAETIAAHRAGRSPSERGWETLSITEGMKDGMNYEEATGKILDIGGVCLWTSPHVGKLGTPLCEDGTYASDWKCQAGKHGDRQQCPRDFKEMCADKTCGGGQDYCCAKSCSGQGMALRESAGCQADALDLKQKFVNMIKDPIRGRWQPYSQQRMKAVKGQWKNSTVVVAVTDEHVDKNAIRPCMDNPEWKDKQSDTCTDYEQKEYCTPVGEQGEGWKGGADEGLEHPHYITAAGSAGDACCACGGGYYDDPFANIPTTSTTTTALPTPEPTPEPILEPSPEPEAPAPEPETAESDADDPPAEPEASPDEVGPKGAAGRTAASLTGLAIAAVLAS